MDSDGAFFMCRGSKGLEKTPDLAWLDDPEVFRVGQIKAHSDHHFFDGEETYQKQEDICCGLAWSFIGIWTDYGYTVGSARRGKEHR